jgi:hypothetical protein
MACGAEMRLVRVVPDDTMMVPGYEHHTLQCTGCNDVERRLVFTREKTPIQSVPTPAVQPQEERVTPPDAAPAAPAAAASAWARAVARLRGKPSD